MASKGSIDLPAWQGDASIAGLPLIGNAAASAATVLRGCCLLLSMLQVTTGQAGMQAITP